MKSAPSGFRASPQQRHLWALPLATANSPWVQLVVQLDGRLDPDRLAGAVRATLARHEILRTRIRTLDGHAGPVQVIDTAGGELGERYDLTSASDPAAELDRLLASEPDRLNVSDGPTVRIALARLGPRQATLLITAHALVADRRSLRLLCAELVRGYAGQHAPPVPVQYADYAAWHNELLEDADRPGRDHWDSQLSPDPMGRGAGLAAPAGPPGGTAAEWRTRRVPLGGELTAAVEALAVRTATSRRDVFAAGWAVLLWRLGAEHDITVAATLPGRSYPELDDAIGPFSRDVPVVCGLARESSFEAAVRWMHDVHGAAADHVDDLDPLRLDPRSVPVPPGFDYLDEPAPLTAGELTFRVAGERERPVAPLTLRAGHAASGAWAEIGHDLGGMDTGRADELLDRFAVLLRSGATAPDTAVGTLGALLSGERERLLTSARGRAVTPVRRTVPALFAEQAHQTPDAVAVEYGPDRLTYAELDSRSNRLARHLAGHGVGPGRRVVLYLERSPEFVVGMLGVLKAGAAYVPVDVRQPHRRVAFLATEVSSPVVLVQGSRPAPAGLEVPVIRLDHDWPDIAGHGDGPLPGRVDGDAPAYVMYTSGTTGVPNGVPVTHGALLNYLLWAVDAYDLRSGTGSLVHSSVGFDLTVTSLLGPLVAGQRVVLLAEAHGLAGLVSALRSGRDLTLVKLTPSHLDALAQLVEPGDFAGVRVLVLGGEQLWARSLEPLRRALPGLRIVNEYGPTETVVGTCAYEVVPATPHRGPVPIGRPVAGTQVYLLDPALEPVPDGMVGQIHVGGVGVASGYLDRPELTRERFLPDPFVAGGRLYRTGDRARRLPDGAGRGELAYLGRTDDQLTLRGSRVEPGEIESVLRGHPRIGQAAVTVRTDHGDDPVHLPQLARLVAYLVPVPGGTVPAADEVAAYCAQRLPDYLIPAAVVPVAALPTTSNGKLDRDGLRRLPAPGPVPAGRVPARTQDEEVLAGAVAAVLGLDAVGIDDNYFVIGGDSIRSVMVASRAQARGVDVSVADLHRYPTVRLLAEALQTGRTAEPEPHTEPFALISGADRAMMPADVEDAFPLNLLQEGMIFHRDFAAKSAVYHAIASVRLRAPFDLDVMRLVIRQLVERHPMLRTSFDQTTFSRPLQLVHRDFADPLSYQDLRGLPPAGQREGVEGWVEREKQRGFDLDAYPLIRFMAQRLDDETFQFTYGFHHEIVDGWSEALMVTELFGHYFSVIFDEPVAIRAPAASMRDAVALELEALHRQENYDFWDRYLDDATLMRLPRANGMPRADKGAREIVRLVVPVSEELSNRLKQVAAADAVPFKSVLLAAHMAVMYHYNGQTDTLSYTVTNGRPESADGSTAIGLFVNSLALRLRMHGGSWNDLIAATLDSERESLPYRRLPMAELKRHQGNEPLAETLFFFTDYHVFAELDRWRRRGVEHVTSELYGESTFPFCAIFRLNRDTSRLEVRVEYDSLQFRAELMDDISGCYLRVLQAIAEDPAAHYHTTSLLSAEEQHRALVEWNDSGPPFGGPERIHDLIESRARRAPDAIAVESGAGSLSNAELHRRARLVAAALRARGAGPERTVGVLAGRSLETVICLVGILMTGAAYLPLDPAAPDQRIAEIIADADPVLVLAEPGHDDRVRPVPVLRVEPGLPFTHEVRATRATRATRVGADGAAYVIYTSGSTGAPKGVVVTHRSLVNSTLARQATYSGPPERFLLLSLLAFDSSVAGIFWTLCLGGTLVLPPEDIQLEPVALARHVAERRITHTLGVPSLFAALLEQDRPERLESLRTLIAAGEPCPRELHQRHRGLLPDGTLFNEYGPTECTVWSTVWSGDPLDGRPQLPIGRPVAGVRTHVLNPHLQPVPAGVTAELYLGGGGVARGYLRRPGLTAASFLPDPFADSPGARMYRTGDLVRTLPGGDLEFLGRTDNQVKIRGFRIELGEIEGLLDTHPDIRRSVVLAREDGTGQKMLVAYAVARAGATPDPAQLAQYVRDRLPKYLVPATCVVLDALPLTPTGKVDRAALPTPTRPDRTGVEAAPPGTETEQLLAAIWCRALGLDQIGVGEDFFDIGGESLLAMQVVTRTNKVFGLDLSVRSLFDFPTVLDFAGVVDQARATGRPPTPVA